MTGKNLKEIIDTLFSLIKRSPTMNYRTLTILLSIVLLFDSKTFAQTTRTPKNFPGLLAGIEWNSISGTWGLEYERTVFTKTQLTVGVKASYIAQYEYDNMEILSSSSCCETASHMMLVGSGSYYTGARKNLSGFFLHSGLGIAFGRLRYKSQSYNNEQNILRPAFEIGPGLQFKLGDVNALKWKATAAFGSFKGAFTSTTLSFGF